MEEHAVYRILTAKGHWGWKLLYWLLAAALMFFVFSNRSYDLQIRLALVGLLMVMSVLLTRAINHYLVPKFLFRGRLLLFAYLLLAAFITSLWIIFLAVFGIVTYSAYNLPQMLIPRRTDILILIAGNYLVVVVAAVIHFIGESYRRLSEKNRLEQQQLVIESKLRDARLMLLQGQIHPHFLFNMLNNLYGLVKTDYRQAREVILKLSELLEYMLYENNTQQVSLARELQFIDNYIALERIRHDESFDVSADWPAQTGDARIAPLLLFPFVENAFKHGMKNSARATIRMKCTLDGDRLEFGIENTFEPHSYDKYLEPENKGIGLKNVSERLAMLYPGKHKLIISDEKGIFSVHLNLHL